MSDAPKDTAPTEVAARVKELADLLDAMASCADSGLDLSTDECAEVAGYLRIGQVATADLLRLCGPPCPRDGKRAIECGRFHRFNDGSEDVLLKPGHLPAPEIEQWLRERG